MDTTLLIVVIVAVVVLAVIVALATKASRRKKLQSRFGPEYDRTVERRGSKRKAVRDLQERAETRDQLHLRDLTPAERDRYRDEWQSLQASFVDRPSTALTDADRLVSAVMRDRGYPVEDFEQQAGLVSVDHPQVVEHYRAAHRIHERSHSEKITTEDQRRALVHYRALFDEIMIPSHDGHDGHDGRDDHDRRDDHVDAQDRHDDRDRRDDRVVDVRDDVHQADRTRH